MNLYKIEYSDPKNYIGNLEKMNSVREESHKLKTHVLADTLREGLDSAEKQTLQWFTVENIILVQKDIRL